MRLFAGLTLCLAGLVGAVTSESFSQCAGRAMGDYIPGSSGCRSFIYCSGDYSYEDTCPKGLYFNPENGICDDPANVPCQDDESADVEKEVKPKEAAIPPPLFESQTTAPVPGNLTPKPPKSTPAGPPLWTSTTWASTESTPTPLTLRPEEPSSPIWSSTPPLPQSTTAGWPTPSWTNTSPVPITTTGWPQNTSSTWASTESTPAPFSPIWSSTPPPQSTTAAWPTASWTNSSPVNATTGWPLSTTTTTTTEVTWETTHTTPPSVLILNEMLKQSCIRKLGGYFAYPNDCRYFYRCTDGKLIRQECASGYGWDAKLKMCTTSGCSFRHAYLNQ